VGAERGDQGGRQVQRAPALLRLRLLEDEPPADPLEGVRDPERAGVEVDVLPAQAQDLPLPQPEHQGEPEEGFKALASGGGQHRLGLGGREGATSLRACRGGSTSAAALRTTSPTASPG
jgi:hypothetical protein